MREHLRRHNKLKKIFVWSIATVFFVFTIRALGGWFLASTSYCYSNGHIYHEDVCGLPLYPYWEYLTWRHSNEFFAPLEQGIANGCLTEPAQYFKVMTYQQTEAIVWYKGKSGSTWLSRFQRPNKNSQWTILGQENGLKFCSADIINSTMGGSADGFFWYN